MQIRPICTVCKTNYLNTAEQAIRTKISSTNEIPEEYSYRMRKKTKTLVQLVLKEKIRSVSVAKPFNSTKENKKLN